MPAVSITDRVTLDKAAISRAVISLIKKKLATRTLQALSGTIDIMLTEAGRNLYRSMMLEMQDIQDLMFADISDSDVRTFFATLDKVERTVRRMASPAGAAPARQTGSRSAPSKDESRPTLSSRTRSARVKTTKASQFDTTE